MEFTIVICPGAWPVVQLYQPLLKAFEKKQQTAICKVPPAYPAYDLDDPPRVNPDSDYLRRSVLDPLLDEGKDVVILTQSYGGVYGPSSLEGTSKKERQAEGLDGGVIAIILTASFVAPKGSTALTAMGADPAKLPEWIIHDDSTDLVAFDKQFAKKMLFHELQDEEAEKIAGMLPKQPFICFTTPVHWDPYQDPNFRGKLGYIFTDRDNILPLEVQKMYVQMGGIEKTRLLENSSHAPHVEQPDELAEMVLDLVKEVLGDDKPYM